MEPLRDDSSTSRDQGSPDNLERARLYFEKKAGRPVSSAEAREWLDRLVEYLRTAQIWAREAAEREESERPMQDAQQADHEASGISTQDVQQTARGFSPDIQQAARVSDQDIHQADHEASGISSVDALQAGHEASGMFTIGDQQDDQVISSDIQRTIQVPDQDAPQADQQAARECSRISSPDIQGLPSPRASRRIAARGRPRMSRRNIPANTPGISMDVRMDEHSARTARSGQE